MTELLRKAFNEASKLPSEDQDAIAALLLGELESDRKWDIAFCASADVLENLARDAINEDDRGETKDLNPTSL